ncbi:ubiquinone biosynthesis protein COQ11 NDAI_0I01840 [Naumovozyma dairenensis CBS 421]|uniref:NAD-dependent epimerase/dehydratase domain-containing protein n=1 Tax=Naumovozyma dairenensis (strain ATCC 10597 / BCRC 20456 / CBS 421 / NBRC 0211 / NRRL Y-12639) TaxID=1071378 RepID=G0WG42_NAUDC|nr:hypothetical protein NDAI_0I01840 [Naumovozyma dairenensis CBS 421]CCD26753.1 hypothetical protein NDAI_0I01840 [Naumovozyma dairenensis CBS 421]
MQTILVFGGNGFLGKRICQSAINSGFKVLSLSRSGRPPASLNTEKHKNSTTSQWVNEVNWIKADIFDPNSYKHLLNQNINHVVHSIGVLLENSNYKSLMNSPSASSLSKVNNEQTYERINKQSALLLASTFHDSLLERKKSSSMNENDSSLNQNCSFTYISADKGFPLIPKGYINSKRETEFELLQKYLKQKDGSSNTSSSFRPIIMRPGFMFDETLNTGTRSYLNSVLSALDNTNQSLFQNKLPFIRPTVSTQAVSNCLISEIKDKNFTGVVSLEEILKF